MPPHQNDTQGSPSSLRPDAAAWTGGAPAQNRFEVPWMTPSGQTFAFTYTAMNCPTTPRRGSDVMRLPSGYDAVYEPQP